MQKNCKVLSCLHLQARRELIQGVKAGKKFVKRGHTTYRSRGSGWAENIQPCQIYVNVECDGQETRFRIDWFFRQKFDLGNGAKLTNKRINKIISHHPETLIIENIDGEWQISESDLQDWFNQAFS